jgi:AbrB family looped-hinge helix DNA binding protein
MKRYTATVQKRFTITIPKGVRELLGIHVGDKLGIKVKDRKIFLEPFVKPSRKAVEETYGIIELPPGKDIRRILKEPELGLVD